MGSRSDTSCVNNLTKVQEELELDLCYSTIVIFTHSLVASDFANDIENPE